MTDRLRAVPAWAWLVAIVALSFAVRAWLARGMLGPFIMVDELIYSEMAKSFASGLGFAVRELPVRGYGAVYPILISPSYALFGRIPEVYAALKTINSLVMSLAAVPAYLLARRVVSKWPALLAALMAVAVPSMVYTATVMTENAYYPIFLFAALALVALLERPSLGRYVAFFAALGLAYLTRSQAIVVAAAAVTAPLLLGLFRRGAFRATVWTYRWLYVTFGVAAATGFLGQVARGRPLSALLGSYAVVGQAEYDVGKSLHFVVYHLAELNLYVGVIPVAAAIVLTARARSLDEPLKVLLAGSIALVGWTAIIVGTFASRFADRIQERNMFALAPLLVILLLAWVERGAPRPRILGPVAAAAAALLVLAIPFDRFVTTSAVSDTLMLLPWWAIQINTQITWLEWLAFLGAAVFAAAFAIMPRRYALVLPLIVLVYWIVASRPIWFGPYPYGVRQAGAGALFQGIRGVERDWIDRAVPAGSDVAVLWTRRSDRFTVNQNEFFNRRVGQVYYTVVPSDGGVGELPVSVDGRTGIVRLEGGRPVRPGYILTDGSVEPDARPIVRDPLLGMTVWKVNGPLVLARTTTTGLYPNDTWSGPVVTWSREHCRGGTLTVSLSGDAQLFPDGNTVSASAGRRVRVVPNEVAKLRVPLTQRKGTCTVRFDVSPTAIPSEVIPGNTDDRVLGAHFNAFAYEPR
ncbi:glycosyltransferase family 39 protein [Gaiella sp.]|uniref:glycosyltransferase family 39 protein n=1 Tax=Gaiella sp. TaxID=2663207 RepID=UPI003265B9B3